MLYYYFRSKGKVIFYIAFTSIITLLLLDKQTLHSQFKILIILNKSFINSITKNSKLADLLYIINLVIWDKVLI